MAFPEKTPVFLRVSQATTPYFSQKTQKFYLFVKDPQVKLCIFAVAPPRGGRGLKCGLLHRLLILIFSRPPSRGAWIEIMISALDANTDGVAPPRGGRGLKCSCHAPTSYTDGVAPPRGGVD